MYSIDYKHSHKLLTGFIIYSKNPIQRMWKRDRPTWERKVKQNTDYVRYVSLLSLNPHKHSIQGEIIINIDSELKNSRKRKRIVLCPSIFWKSFTKKQTVFEFTLIMGRYSPTIQSQPPTLAPYSNICKINKRKVTGDLFKTQKEHIAWMSFSKLVKPIYY